ncbi:NADAR family protein [Dyella silvatica]|uniref:NADAR family protein n=1 Tax=Dyella silvatica TaxID=2992128 RepID=UPI0022595E6D|nr:NADAR family protein [Dyella silvatica]
MISKEDLLRATARGEQYELLFFWGHRAKPGTVTKSCLSQWYDAPFVADGVRYLTAEHYMMAHKAELFGDIAARDAILRAPDPGKAKALGRRVKGFDEALWAEHRFAMVVDANRHKFSQAGRLKRFLLNTGTAVLVEASPSDAVWGIGLAADDADAKDPSQWPGLNLLGFALMQVREALRASAA